MKSLSSSFQTFLTAGSLLISLACFADNPSSGAPAKAPEAVDVALVWSAHSVGFSLLTRGDCQFVAFYDSERQMTLAQRRLGEKTWKFKSLPSKLGWDSHNYIAMALDRDGILHVSGNMHVAPLVYFRGCRPFDIDGVEQVSQMTGEQENCVTYPKFFDGPNGELLFSYRDGRSGNGNVMIDVYDERSKSWSRWLDSPLADGGGKMNAYMKLSPKLSDGYYHALWVWRDSSDAVSCHDLSYMRSRDLKSWEAADGKALPLPVSIKDKEVVVDPVPVKGGILNGCYNPGFDLNGALTVSYYKYDAGGKTQLYLAQFEKGLWRIHQASSWDWRWDFGGKGSLPDSGVSVGGLEARDGKLFIAVSHKLYGSGLWEIDPQTMTLTGGLKPDNSPLMAAWKKPQSQFPGMLVKWSHDFGKASDGREYSLRWESLPANRDHPRQPPLPPPSMLRVIGVAK